MLRLGLIVAVSLACGSLTQVAHARDARAEAAAHYQRGLELSDKQNFRQAVVEFQRAYELVPHYSVLYNLGIIYATLGDSARAVDALERYLAEGSDAVPSERRAEVNQELDKHRSNTAKLVLYVEPAGAEVLIDGKKLGAAPFVRPITLAHGAHVIEVTGLGYITASKRIELAPLDERELRVHLNPQVKQVKHLKSDGSLAVLPKPRSKGAPTSFPNSPEDEQSPGFDRRLLGWTLVGAGTLGLGIGGFFAFKTATTLDDLHALCPPPECTVPRHAQDERQRQVNEIADDASETYTAAALAFAVGGAAVLSGVTLVLTAPSRTVKARTVSQIDVRATSGSAAISWRRAW